MNHVSFSQGELFPISDYTQRWQQRQQSWRHPDEGGFNAKLYDVAPIKEDKAASNFITAHHYSGSCPAMVFRFGVYELGQLVGVAVLSVPTQVKVLTTPFPQLAPYKESLELGRFVLLDRIPSNAETWFLARVFEYARKEGIAGIVSFSDPVPRTNQYGDIIFPGHIGHIYKAKGAIYTGRTDPRTLFLLPDGTVLSERTLQKIRKGEQGHVAAERRLCKWGAPEKHSWETSSQWLQRALPAAGIRRIRHTGNHRYLFPLKKRIYVALPPLPSPLPWKNERFS